MKTTTKREENIIKQAGKRKMLKLARYMPKLYNKLCAKCKLSVIRLAKRGESHNTMRTISKCSECETLMIKAERDLK
jgi:hypothetical protein|tara:strand:- start:4294 stop:4524 length:231 start_codon:yes stop_codon:yes gene_type:complete